MKNKVIITIFYLFLVLGVNAQKVFLDENFTTGSVTTPPTGWKQNQLYTTAPPTDFWRFDNPGFRSIGGNFSGQFAIFDSDNYSNNAVFENIALESPVFNTQGYDTVSIVYDYRLGNGGTAAGYLEGFNGESWVEIRFYPNTYVANQRDTIDISAFVRNNCKAQVRFRWTSNSGGHFAVDNIKVYSKRSTPKTTNGRPTAFVTPVNGVCGSSNVVVNVRVRNDGTSTIGGFPVQVKIFDGNATQTISQNAPSNILTCRDTVITFSTTVSMNTDSTFTLTAITGVTGDQQKHNSDTLIVKNIKINRSPAIPSPQLIRVCGFGKYKDSVQLNPGDDAFWYDKSTGGSPIQAGKYFNIDPFNKDSIVYVETLRAKKAAFPVPNKSPNIGYNGISSGLFFDIYAFSDIIIDSIQVDTRLGGSFPYTIMIRKGTYVGNNLSSAGWTTVVNSTVTVTTATNMQLYAGGVKINQGETVGFYFYNSGTNTIEFASGPVTGTNTDIRYYSNDVHPLTQFSAGLKNFGYGGTIFYRKACYGARVKREFDVNKKPAGARIIRTTPFKGFIDGERDVIKEKDTLIYELTAPTGYSNTNYGTNWTIADVSLTTAKGITVPGTDYIIVNYPTAAKNFKIKYISPAGWADSTIFIRIRINELITVTKCDSLLTKEIFIGPTPKSNFTAKNVCMGEVMEFENISTIKSGFTTFRWFFGNGDSSNVISPVYLYPSYGLFNVRLIATSGFNIEKDTTIQVEVYEIPNVNFKVTNACFGDSVGFNNSSTISKGSLTYNWKFGDGKTSTKVNPRYKYAAPGGYPVTLVASSSGCSNSITKNANQFLRPTANFSFTGNCSKNNIAFQNLTTIGFGDQYGSQWFFGDGTGNNHDNPEHIYNTEGNKNVKYIATSQFGCKDSITKTITIIPSPEASFTTGQVCNIDPVVFTNTSVEPAGILVSYAWDFGDGTNSNNKNPQHLYPDLGNKIVILNAAGNNGCVTTFQKEIKVLLQPTADFTAIDACIGNNVIFTNKTKGGGIINFKWKFGDGDSSTIFSPVKRYDVNVASTFNVTLIATTVGGCQDVTVSPINIKETPKCGFKAVSAGTGGFEYKFTPDVKSYTFYQWSFEGGGSSNDIEPIYKFQTDGKYKIRVLMKTADGCDCIDSSHFVMVNHLGIKPLAFNNAVAFYPNPNNGSFNVKVSNISPQEIFDLNIIDMTGRKLHSIKLTGNVIHELSYDDLVNGVYTIEIIKNSGERISSKMDVLR